MQQRQEPGGFAGGCSRRWMIGFVGKTFGAGVLAALGGVQAIPASAAVPVRQPNCEEACASDVQAVGACCPGQRLAGPAGATALDLIAWLESAPACARARPCLEARRVAIQRCIAICNRNL